MADPVLIHLTPEEIRAITGYRMPKKQCEALAYMEIPFKVRPDGTPFVARAAIETPQETRQRTKRKPTAIIREI